MQPDEVVLLQTSASRSCFDYDGGKRVKRVPNVPYFLISGGAQHLREMLGMPIPGRLDNRLHIVLRVPAKRSSG
jgi:hypothetical protein